MNMPHTAPSLDERGTLTAGVGLDTAPVPLEPYRSQAFFDAEVARVFRRAWLMIGRVEELPEVGSFFLRSLDPTGVSALVTRSRAGRIQAFHNSCAHRGSAVVEARAGRQDRFVCPYHKWTYGDDGRLLGATDQADFFGLDKARCGLAPIATEVWEGWIFVNVQPTPEVSLETFLGPMKDYLAGIAYRPMGSPVTVVADLDANWKVVSDAFIESYHVPYIHPRSLAGPFASSVNPYGRFLSATLLGPHQAVSYFGNPDYSIEPRARVEALAAACGATRDASYAEGFQRFLAHPAVNPSGSRYWSMDTNAVFPNSHIDSGMFGSWTHQFWPLGLERTRYEGRFYLGEAANFRERFEIEAIAARLIEVVTEDLANVARTQRGIRSGGQSHMQLKDSEVSIRHALAQVRRWVEAASVAEALA
ncbi:MAG: aromatic ring-hydroxylating dioxygenase subunit alpha [Gammaproteobacteria bacterium]